jgi:hypothetical protein
VSEGPGGGACVLVHSADAAAAALRLAGGRRLVLLSAEGAAGLLGPRGWRALVTRAAELAPGAAFGDLLCCGDAPGHALAALRKGCRALVLDGGSPAYARVAEAASECGAVLLPARPPALDLRRLDLRRPAAAAILAQWLAAAPDDSGAPGG